ncbi:MAG TPA: SDR family oxidoreductase [Flavobacteriales bacterium]|nr:SDR family oxidoreductase [Flavobacteriales bacterium]
MANGPLTGQHALVCGGTQGIGRAVAHELALGGATVTLLARDPNALNEVRSSLPAPAGQLHQVLACDMADTAALGAAVAGLVHEGPIDILINNTGGPSPGPAHEAETSAFLAAFTQHLIGFQTIVRAVVPGMKAKKHGRIINVISTSVKQPLPNLGVSNTIRGAVANWGKSLANELGPFGITVNNVLPGATSTDRLKAIIQAKAAKTGSTAEEVRTEMLAEIPLRRFAEPAEIAAAVAFLAGPSAAYINGINLPVDGGRTACL